MCVCAWNDPLPSQHALRLIAFGKLHLVLGVDPLPAPASKVVEEASTEAGDAEEKAETTSVVGTKRDADETPDPENCKKIRLEDQ